MRPRAAVAALASADTFARLEALAGEQGRTVAEVASRALEEYVIGGIETTIPLHLALIREPDFVNGAYDIHWLEEYIANKA